MTDPRQPTPSPDDSAPSHEQSPQSATGASWQSQELSSQLKDEDAAAMIPALDPSRIEREVAKLITKVYCAGMIPFLTGEPGTGKTTMVEQIAAVMRLPYLRVPCDSGLVWDDLLGGYELVDQSTRYRLGLFVKVMQRPSIILVDEANAMDPAKSFLFHQLLDSRSVFVKEANRTYTMHDDAAIFLSANPPGPGNVCGVMNPALVSRCAVIEVPPFTLGEVQGVLANMHPELDRRIRAQLCKFYDQIQRLTREQGMNTRISIREILRFAKLLKTTDGVRQALDLAFIYGTTMTDGREVLEACQRIALAVFGDEYGKAA